MKSETWRTRELDLLARVRNLLKFPEETSVPLTEEVSTSTSDLESKLILHCSDLRDIRNR